MNSQYVYILKRHSKDYLIMSLKYFYTIGLFLTITFNLSAQNVITLDFLYTIGENGDGLGQFYRPQAISIDPAGNIYVADTGNHRIQRFDEKGIFLSYIGGIGTGKEQFDTPSDIWAQDGLNVYVADQNNHRIHQFDRKLNAISIFSGDSPQDPEFQFLFPISLAVSSQGDQFIIESENNSVLKFNSFFSPVTRFGAIETGEGILNHVEKIELINNEFVCVTDGQAARIVVFDYFGNFIQYLGEDILKYPAGLCYWPEKKLILVSDLALEAIFGFFLSGEFFKFLQIQKLSGSKWQSPVDLIIRQNKLMVLDQDKHQILVYQISSFPE